MPGQVLAYASYLRGEGLLQQSQIVLDLAEGLVGGPQAAAAAAYGVTGNSVTKLQDERNDYAAFIASPQQKITARKARTAQYRARFNAVEAFLDTLDALILPHRTNAAGRAFVADYQSARVIRDLESGSGGGGGTSPPIPTPTPSPTPPPMPPPPGP